MDDSGWKNLIITTKDLVNKCEDKMKRAREGFESFRWRISRLFWPLMTQITWPKLNRDIICFIKKK